MSEMIERVARAIYENSYGDFDVDKAKSMARAAIAVMREPTDAMVANGECFFSDFAYVGRTDELKSAWRVMIGTALE